MKDARWSLRLKKDGDPERAGRNGGPWVAPIAVTIGLTGHAHEDDDADRRLCTLPKVLATIRE